MADRVVFWDFDGTLARRPGLWSACILEVLDEADPEHEVQRVLVNQVHLAEGEALRLL